MLVFSPHSPVLLLLNWTTNGGLTKGCPSYWCSPVTVTVRDLLRRYQSEGEQVRSPDGHLQPVGDTSPGRSRRWTPGGVLPVDENILLHVVRGVPQTLAGNRLVVNLVVAA